MESDMEKESIFVPKITQNIMGIGSKVLDMDWVCYNLTNKLVMKGNSRKVSDMARVK